jgi:hypothetical protein
MKIAFIGCVHSSYRALANLRGVQCNAVSAEAFMLIKEII